MTVTDEVQPEPVQYRMRVRCKNEACPAFEYERWIMLDVAEAQFIMIPTLICARCLYAPEVMGGIIPTLKGRTFPTRLWRSPSDRRERPRHGRPVDAADRDAARHVAGVLPERPAHVRPHRGR